MMRQWIAAGIAVAVAGLTHGKSPPKHAATRPAAPTHAHPAPPLRPLPMLPRVARVRVEPARDRIVVVEDVQLPRGEWQSGSLDLYIAFGSPGTPMAIDARLIVPSSAGVDSRPEDRGDSVPLDDAPRRPPGAQPLLGKPQMAGVIAHVKESQLRRAYAVADGAVLRVRTLLVAPAADPTGARDAVVRLGVSDGQPLTLGRIQVGSLEGQPWITHAEAFLCGPEAVSLPLTVAMLDRAPDAPKSPSNSTIAPEFAVRHASDDLCVRWWGLP